MKHRIIALVVIIAIILVGLKYWDSISGRPAGDLKDYLTSFGLVAAGFVFVYRIAAGWLVANLTVGVKTYRQRHVGGRDYLVITVRFVKGNIDTVRLRGVYIRVESCFGGELVEEIALLETRRIRWENDELFWGFLSEKNKFLSIASGEECTLESCLIVDASTVYKVSLVVVGDRFRDRVVPSLGQWRASAISLPLEEAARVGAPHQVQASP